MTDRMAPERTASVLPLIAEYGNADSAIGRVRSGRRMSQGSSGGRKHTPFRLMRVEEPSENKFWTAKEWAMKTRMPYRSILAAAARGEINAVRPSGTAHGAILISEASWAAWLERNSVAAPASRVRRARAGAKQLGDLALR